MLKSFLHLILALGVLTISASPSAANRACLGSLMAQHHAALEPQSLALGHILHRSTFDRQNQQIPSLDFVALQPIQGALEAEWKSSFLGLNFDISSPAGTSFKILRV